MRKLAWLALILFVVIVIVATLGAVNYAGIGDAIGGFMQNSLILPIRNFFVDGWNFIGTSGWYIVVAFLAISVFGAVFWVPVFYHIFIQKGIQQKLLHKGEQAQTVMPQPMTSPQPIIIREEAVPTKAQPTNEEAK